MASASFANEKSGTARRRRRAGYSRTTKRKSSKSAGLARGKIIPKWCDERRRNDWNGPVSRVVVGAKQNTEDKMYIGLGGILLLILILWLLGVI
jgi:hypothetical protein